MNSWAARSGEAHGHRLAVHDLEHLEEVLLLQLKFVKAAPSVPQTQGRRGSHARRAALTQEHVLGAAQADTLGFAELDGAWSRRVSALARTRRLSAWDRSVDGFGELAGFPHPRRRARPASSGLRRVGGDGRVAGTHAAERFRAGLAASMAMVSSAVRIEVTGAGERHR